MSTAETIYELVKTLPEEQTRIVLQGGTWFEP
jgi:hypothetical protein